MPRPSCPSWRLDVAGEADLAEEVGRHVGLDKIAPALPPASRVGGLRRSQRRERQIREILTGTGFTEVVNYDFVAGNEVVPSPGVRLANPLTVEQDTLRTSLVMPGLVTTLRTNLRLGRRDLAVFELGRVFLPGPQRPAERRRLGILLSGQWHPRHWSAPSRPFDLFDVKGVLELLFARLGEAPPVWDREAEPPAFLHPGARALLGEAGRSVGYAGALHPEVRDRLELKDEVGRARARPRGPAGVGPRASALPGARPLPAPSSGTCRSSATRRCRRPRSTRACARAAGERLRSVSLVDRYTGNQVPAGQGEPDRQPALPGPGAHAHERRGAGGDGRRGAGAPRGGARDPGRVREASVEEGFKLLEDRIQRAAERLKELTAETKSLRAEAAKARTSGPSGPSASSQALKERAGGSAAAAEKAEALASEVKTLLAEREELRARVEKLAGTPRPPIIRPWRTRRTSSRSRSSARPTR